jgi:hypothetical protein
MTNDDRLLELRRQRDFLRGPEFRTSVQARRDILSVIVPLLNFNDVYYSNAVPVADVLGRPGFSSTFYDHAHAQIDSIVSQAINELEYGLTPASSPEMPLVPADNNETGAKWWLRYVVVPIIGGGGIVAIIVALLSGRPKLDNFPLQIDRHEEIPYSYSFREPSLDFAATWHGWGVSKDTGNIPFAGFNMKVGKESHDVDLVENETYTFTSHNAVYAFSWTFTTGDQITRKKWRVPWQPDSWKNATWGPNPEYALNPFPYLKLWLRNEDKK